jgi:hypothetical protein
VIVELVIGEGVIRNIFRECEKYDQDETGGRLVGVYTFVDNVLNVRTVFQIGPGPNAQRTPTSFIQDGDWQEQEFRRIERKIVNIEHLGNWHTHHVNGLQTLSQGDADTYRRIVNSPNHNTDFFYALLVTRKLAPMAYEMKHFFLLRNNPTVYEIKNVRIE